LKGRWRKRRNYWWKQINGIAWCIGQHKKIDRRWWIGYSRSATKQKTFCQGSFATVDEAKCAAVLASTTGVAQKGLHQ
jgi:hypothetical protein